MGSVVALPSVTMATAHLVSRLLNTRSSSKNGTACSDASSMRCSQRSSKSMTETIADKKLVEQIQRGWFHFAIQTAFQLRRQAFEHVQVFEQLDLLQPTPKEFSLISSHSTVGITEFCRLLGTLRATFANKLT